jgi:hypothetical protein
MIVVTKPDFVGALGFAVRELQELNGWSMVLALDLCFFFNNPAAPMQRKRFWLLSHC